MTPSSLLTHAELVIAVATLLGIAKSWYNGTIGDVLEALGSISQIDRKLDHIEDRQESMAQQQDRMIDGVVALSISQEREGARVDTDQLIDELRDGRGVQVFLENHEPSKPYVGGWDAEDEEEEAAER